ncbi:hypothetical protein [Streptomyces sp. NPDC008125]|uniref:hypothetical protein n=1 Tax=Streptomyces sp. NPDC008125 TaxID=3364811 RepID=UPI0036E9467A
MTTPPRPIPLLEQFDFAYKRLAAVRWVNQELLHHGTEIALVRAPYRARQLRRASG